MSDKGLPLIAIAFVTASAAIPCTAEILNVLPDVAKLEQGPALVIKGSLDWEGGNTDMVIASGQGMVAYRGTEGLIYFVGGGSYGLVFDEEFKRSYSEHLRYRREYENWLAVEAFAQHDYDAFRLLRYRALAGAGPRLGHDFGIISLYFGFAMMAEWEADKPRICRSSNYVELVASPIKRITLAMIAFIQPRMDRPSDYRAMGEASARIELAEHLSLDAAAALDYDSEPQSGVDELEMGTKLSLVFEL